MSPPKIVSYLRDSNIADYQNIQSDDEIINLLLSNSSSRRRRKSKDIKAMKEYINARTEEKTEIKKGENVLNAISDVLQSITTEAITTTEMLEILYSRYTEEVVKHVSNFIKIVHGEENKIKYGNEKGIEFKDTPFSLKKEATPKYAGSVAVSKARKSKKIEFYKHKEEYGITTKETAKQTNGNNSIFNVEEICNAKASETQDDVPPEDKLTSYVNQTKSGVITASKENPSMSCILVDSPDLRIGTRNSLELSTFFNTLSTVELSKCQPFFNTTFILPSLVENSAGEFGQGSIFKTASITQFFDGTPIGGDSFSTKVYRNIEASINRKLDERKGKPTVNSINTNISAFTMPQTINNFNEIFVGHNENIDLNTDFRHTRSTSIHDITRPFMTIKSFTIDVAPTQGLLSFKTGKLSIILHDRTRMVDIAPFIKPDLFGSYGAEIAIEYGWSHTDSTGNNNDNYISEFLNNSRVTEKYIITNSSFNMDNTGQVNIDLSIAMRGPVDIRSVILKSDADTELNKQSIIARCTAFETRMVAVSTKTGKQVIIEQNITAGIRSEVNSAKNTGKTLNLGSIPTCNSFASGAFKIKKELNRKMKVREGGKTKSVYAINSLQEILKVVNKHLVKNASNPNGFIKPIKINYKGNEIVAGPAPATAELEKQQAKSFKDGSLAFSAVDIVRNTFVRNLVRIASSISGIQKDSKEAKEKQQKLVKKMVGGINKSDPFYNKLWVYEYYKAIKSMEKKLAGPADKDKIAIPLKFIDKANLGNYVSFGNFVLGLVGTHLSNTGKFDEIQLVFYTANENCGLMSNLNISSFLIERSRLDKFLNSIFEAGVSLTLESVISQVIERFISTRRQICYGLSDLYETTKSGAVVGASKDTETQKINVDKRLQAIYKSLTNDEIIQQDDIKDDFGDVRFVMPKVKFTFDTMTSKKSNFERTISRISIFDQNDNPFASVNTIMKTITDKEGIVGISAQLNRLRARYKSGQKLKGQKLTRREFYKRSQRLINKLVKSGALVDVSGNGPEGSYVIKGQFKLDTIKNSIKNTMPSLTYATQNSAIIDASVSTVNEAKLNTIYLTRTESGREKEAIGTKVKFQKDLPLRVLPAQAQITIFGCPFVNFAQYLFLDFETGTTLDNAYAVTGIKHDIAPGKFTTQLTLSYGDVYGKYENSAATIGRTIANLKGAKSIKQKVPDAENPQSANTQLIEFYTKGRPVNIGDKFFASINTTFDIVLNKEGLVQSESGETKSALISRLRSLDSFSEALNRAKQQRIVIKTILRHWKEDISYFFKENDYEIDHSNRELARLGKKINVISLENNLMINANNAGKKYKVKLDLLEHTKIFSKFCYSEDGPLRIISDFAEQIYYQSASPYGSLKLDTFASKFGITEVKSVEYIVDSKISTSKLEGLTSSKTGLFLVILAKFVKESILKELIRNHLSLFYVFNFDYKGNVATSDGNIQTEINLEFSESKKTKLVDLFEKNKQTKKELLANAIFNFKHLKVNFNRTKNKKLGDILKRIKPSFKFDQNINNELIALADYFIEEFYFDRKGAFCSFVESDVNGDITTKNVTITYKELFDDMTRVLDESINLNDLIKVNTVP